MKLLIIGIDGGDPSLINRNIMPSLHSLISNGHQPKVSEDLWSRGWAEMLCGAHGHTTGAFYSKPKLDGTHSFTQSFRATDYKKGGAKPIWDYLSEQKITLGIMNFPTTMPAPQVHGFCVSGAGGGFGGSGQSEIPSEAVFPHRVLDTLVDIGYIFDTRLHAAEYRKSHDFLERLSLMQQRRADAFLALNDEFRPDVGMIAFMGTTRIQYAAYKDVQKALRQPSAKLNSFQQEIFEVYQSLDRQIGRLVEKIDPRHIIIVSDHGAAPFESKVNLNMLLRDFGVQKGLSPNSFKAQVRRIAQLVPTPLRTQLAHSLRHTKEKIAATASGVDWEKSLAFGHRYVSGIYINDARFGGYISESQRLNLVKDLVTEINSLSTATGHGIQAEPYRNRFANSFFQDLLPDIWINAPDTVFFEQKGPFWSNNPQNRYIDDFSTITEDVYSGIKGRIPLLRIDASDQQFLSEDDPQDLTLAYHLALRILKK